MNQIEKDFGYFQLFSILIHRRWWFLGGLTAALAGATLLTLQQEPIYESSMQLIIEPNFEEEYDPADSEVNPSEQQRQVNYATQLNLMRSNELLKQAVDELSSSYPNLNIFAVKQSLNLSRVKEGDVETRIIRVSYRDPRPDRAQQFLTALQDVYRRYALERQEQRLTNGLRAINNQLDEARRGLIDSQLELKTFRQDQNLIDPQEQAIALANALNQVLAEQQATQSEYSSTSAAYENLLQQVDLSPESAFLASRLSQSTRFQTLLNALQTTELELAERQSIFSVEDPGVQTLMSTRQNQLTLLQQEASRITGQPPSGFDSPERFLDFGQLSELDLNIVQSMVDTQNLLESLEARYQSLAQTEDEIRTALNAFPEMISEYDRLKPEVETEQEVLQEILTQREVLSAELARGGFNWQIVVNPSEALKVGPDPKKNLLLGGIIGILLGTTAAFLSESLDTVIRREEDVKKGSQLPLLGILSKPLANSSRNTWNPLQRSQTARSQSSLSNIDYWINIDYWLALRNSLDIIYRNMQLYRTGVSRSIAITSPLPDEGVSILSLGLALSAARTGKSVIVVDANCRDSTFHQWLLLPDNQGLSTILNESNEDLDSQNLALESVAVRFESVSAAIRDTQIDILPAGPEPTDPIVTISSQRFQNLIEVLENQYDLVILSSPPILGTADFLAIAACGSDILVNVQLNQITQETLERALSMIDKFNVVGTVASGIEMDLPPELTDQLYV